MSFDRKESDRVETYETASDGEQSQVSSFASFKGPMNTERDSSFVSMEQAITSNHEVIEEAESIEVQTPSVVEPKGSSLDSFRKFSKLVEGIEIHAVGGGFPDYSSVHTAGTSSSSSVSSGDTSGSNKKKRAIRPYTLIAALIFVVCLIIGLAAGISNTATSKSQAANVNGTPTAAPTAVSGPSQEGGNSSTGVGNNNQTDESSHGDEAETPSPTTAATLSPTAAETEFGSEAETMGDSISDTCQGNSVVANSTCQGDFDSTSSIIRFCFASTADGDWYWIRSTDKNNDYDSWEYTDGATEGSVTLTDLAVGNYKASIVRDSMAPYDIIATAEFAVPACGTS